MDAQQNRVGHKSLLKLGTVNSYSQQILNQLISELHAAIVVYIYSTMNTLVLTDECLRPIPVPKLQV